MSLKQHGHFATNGFVFPLFRQMLQNTEKSTLNLWIVVNRIKCKRFLNKGIKNGCPCIVEIRGTQGCALVGDPARAVGECRDVAKAQP